MPKSSLHSARSTPGRWNAANWFALFPSPTFASLAFVNQVGQLAEAAGHHPDIDIRYNRVRLALVTHDAGGLTAKDFDLAQKINGV